MKNFNYCVYIGRFSPPHIGHINTIKTALEQAERVIIVVGSHGAARTIKNPFTSTERIEMIHASLDYDSRINFVPVSDHFYQESEWVKAVQNGVNSIAQNEKAKIAIIGHRKDESSYYIDHFKKWKYIDTECQNVGTAVLSATKIRELMFEGYHSLLHGACTDYVFNYIEDFTRTSHFASLKQEYVDGVKYEMQYENIPYGMVNFVTVDAVVIQSGHILLIERKNTPGKGLMALPGGHVGVSEKLLDACVRELREETGIKVPEKVLRGSIYHSDVFDHPERSLRARVKTKRGRTISHAFGFKLDDSSDLPKIKGGDDALSAYWYTFDEVANMRDRIFEDHASIIDAMLARLK